MESVLVMIFCCLLTGMIALVYSQEVGNILSLAPLNGAQVILAAGSTPHAPAVCEGCSAVAIGYTQMMLRLLLQEGCATGSLVVAIWGSGRREQFQEQSFLLQSWLLAAP